MAMLVATRGPLMWVASGDAISPAWLAARGAAALLVAVIGAVRPATIAARAIALVACGFTALTTLVR